MGHEEDSSFVHLRTTIEKKIHLYCGCFFIFTCMQRISHFDGSTGIQSFSCWVALVVSATSIYYYHFSSFLTFVLCLLFVLRL